jgi:3-methylcrotonyl-CoA carboxylase alpha subunit
MTPLSTQNIRPINSILIANRGEIAVRVIRTAKRMGIRTIAVYSEADANALHVQLADEAIAIGATPARESYLRGDVILAAAKATGADAIHPGYGFLSENADFAEQIAQAGLIFIGPPASSIRAMGSKSAAKALMETANVPLVPGYHGEDQSLNILTAAAERIGYPVLIKASAGGGGKGMRIVLAPDELEAAINSAKRESRNAFGDDRLLIEKYLTKPRHIEIQVFADNSGETVYLFERDCSIQRRHQKVVEEAPAPNISAERRATMGKAAVDAARAVGYVGAGTVEFIAEGDAFFFMEMNTRLQVEHPVTELITGLDLVEWQIRVARGEALPKKQSDLKIHGHAVEVRLYAEDPQRDFLPQTGRITHLSLPEKLPNTRVDTGVIAGAEITIHYDPMIAKIITHGVDRAEAVARMCAALAATEVTGLNTNRAFLLAIASHPAFANAELDTGFIERYRDTLLPPPKPASNEVLAIAAYAWLRQAQNKQQKNADAADPFSPWAQSWGWRLSHTANADLVLLDGDQQRTLTAEFTRDGILVKLPDANIAVSGTANGDGRYRVNVGPQQWTARVVIDGNALTVFVNGGEYHLRAIDPREAVSAVVAGAGHLVAPMPGAVISVVVAVGDKVCKGAALIVVEAMKMEHTIVAPHDGVVKAIHYAAGDQVAEGAELLELELEENAEPTKENAK